jgi:hypothetical protein
MRTSIKLERLINKYTSYMRYDPLREQQDYSDGVTLEKVYCIRESDMRKFISGILKLEKDANSKGCSLKRS